jgi:PAS domain S-box-containing protein
MTMARPTNEAERLAALRALEILDTPPEEGFDELTALAASVCETPIAVISLIDEDRLWFKSKVGLALCAIPRESSFCARTVGQSDLFIVSDARADERFAENPLVTSDPGIRFYAGAPLVTPEGHALGALCVIDHRPRALSAEHVHALRTLSHVVVSQLLLRRDILERRRAEARLRRVTERMELAVRGSNIGLWENDMPGGVLEDGRGHAVNIWEQLGYDRSDRPTRFTDWIDRIHPEDREAVARCIRAHLAGATERYETEYRILHEDGSYRWILSRGVAVRDDSGRPTRFIGSIVDITDRRRIEEALRVAQARLDFAIRASNIGIWEVAMPAGDGRDGSVTFLNCWEPLGYGPAESVYDPADPYRFVHPDDRGRLERATASYLSGETKDYETEYRLRHRDGSYCWALTRGVAERDASDKPRRIIGAVIDITELKRAEAALREAKEIAEAANRAKDEFLANVSHEIRTPMNAILGMTELVLDTPLTGDQRQCLKTIKSAADNLLGIIDDLLDYSKIEAGKLVLDPAEFSLRAALGDILRSLAVRAHRKGLELVCHVGPEVPDVLIGDAGRLRQVLLNIVGNAIKFTHQGEVVARVELDPKPAPPGEVGLRFTVRDTGIGIPPDKQERIFRAFEQEDMSTTRKYGGTGLGLTIAARLVALMGGMITVDSRPGRGSTFTVTARFGCQPQPSEPVADQPPHSLRDLRVLIVDDNATNRHILVEWLRGWQMAPTETGDGAAAMSALWQGVAEGRPHALVLLDARMPDMDGLALAAIIRQRAEFSRSRIILLTSGDRPGDLERHPRLRIDGHLLKPVQQDELLEAIYQVMDRTGGEAVSSPEVVSGLVPAAMPLRILVAEDNEFNAQHVVRLLGLQGHRVQVATDGREALTQAERAVFDVFLLDVHMPELDGFQVVRALRERERATGSYLPVIALTARSRDEDRQRCLAAGMDDYLSKPIRAAELFAAIDRVVNARGVRPTAAPTVGVSDSLLDPVILLAACGGVATLLREICQNFRSTAPALLSALRDALNNQDAPRLQAAAHKLYGTMTAFSTTAGQVASELEDLAALGHLAEARSLMGRLESLVGDLMPQLDGLSVEALRSQAEAIGNPGRTGAP